MASFSFCRSRRSCKRSASNSSTRLSASWRVLHRGKSWKCPLTRYHFERRSNLPIIIFEGFFFSFRGSNQFELPFLLRVLSLRYLRGSFLWVLVPFEKRRPFVPLEQLLWQRCFAEEPGKQHILFEDLVCKCL